MPCILSKVRLMNLRKLRLFARKYDDILTVIGAIIIFGTFLVKEVYRERDKDIESTLHTAQSVFTMRDELQRSLILSDRIIHKLDGMGQMAALQRGTLAQPVSVDELEAEDTKQGLELMKNWNAHVVALEMEMEDKNVHCASDLDKKFDEATKQLGTDVQGARKAMNGIEDELMSCQQTILGAAKTKQKDAHWWEEFWWYWSMVLFSVGWGLTLVGKLAKDEKISGLAG